MAERCSNEICRSRFGTIGIKNNKQFDSGQVTREYQLREIITKARSTKKVLLNSWLSDESVKGERQKENGFGQEEKKPREKGK